MALLEKLYSIGKSLSRRASRFAEEDGVWRTVRGRHIFIKKGQSLEDALNEREAKDKKDPWIDKKTGKRIETDHDASGFKIPPPPGAKSARDPRSKGSVEKESGEKSSIPDDKLEVNEHRAEVRSQLEALGKKYGTTANIKHRVIHGSEFKGMGLDGSSAGVEVSVRRPEGMSSNKWLQARREIERVPKWAKHGVAGRIVSKDNDHIHFITIPRYKDG